MERVQELIDKLYQQRLRQEAPMQLLPTVQQLYDALLLAAQKTPAPKNEKVAVVMPSKPRVAVRSPYEETPRPTVVVPPVAPPPAPVAAPAPTAPVVIQEPEPAPTPAPIVEAAIPPAPPAEAIAPPPPAVPAPAPEPEVAAPKREPYFLQKPGMGGAVEAQKFAQPEPQPEPQPAPQANLFGAHFDLADEAPTLQQQEPKQAPKEIHELISGPQESLNDRLKQERTELAHVLKDTPIKDLRKAVGVNDKFLFVNELFRGDEAMYERSIKTINSFHIFPEAEYWINRELKVKLGWLDQSPTVKHFYQLVRRRFS
ncbi:hypothetical protein [Pseudocnuella soli]|uniref:hypothetical protein n=1 Tax=Pseudocnuella soli TaxID=2502779 RepID=UPI001047D211|nr:hypothetical protein [Pseudocnuella soli]